MITLQKNLSGMAMSIATAIKM